MTYTYPPEEYARQLEVYNELEKLSFSPEDSREYILSKLEERSAKKRVIADIANCCVREYIETFEKDPEAMTAEDAEKALRVLQRAASARSHRARKHGLRHHASHSAKSQALL